MPKRIIFLIQLLIISLCLHIGALSIIFFVSKHFPIAIIVTADQQSAYLYLTDQSSVISACDAGTINPTTQKNNLIPQKVIQKIGALLDKKNKPVQKPLPVKSLTQHNTKQKPIQALKHDTVTTTSNVMRPSLSNESNRSKTYPIAHKNTVDTMIITQQNSAAGKVGLISRMSALIKNKWRPPAGLSKNLECSVKISIDDKGNVVQAAIEKSSEIITYDIAARRALRDVSFPPQLRSRQIIITFNQ